MKQFLLEKYFGAAKGDEKGKSDKTHLNEEFMRKFFEKDALKYLDELRKSNQDVLRKGAITTDKSKKKFVPQEISNKKSDLENVTKEPYFLNTRAADKGGPGSMGDGASFGKLVGMDKERENEGYKKHSFNEFLSRRISLHRSLKDPRFPE